MPKESTIQHYSSSTTGATPAAIDLSTGEFAINIADEKVFFKNLGGTVLSLSQTKDLSGAFASRTNTVTSINGSTGAYSLPLATSSVTGVASFNENYFTVNSSGRVDLANGYDVLRTAGSFINVAGNGSIHNIGVQTLNGLTGARTLTGDGGALVGVNGTNIGARLATITATGVASFSSTNFDVSAAGAVSIKSAGVPNAALANSSFTLRDEVGGTDTISLGDTLTITGGRGVDFIRTTTDTYEVRGVTATSSVLGVASFNSADFTVASGAVSLTNAARTNAANTFTQMQTFSGGLSGNLTGNATTVTVTDTNTGTRFLCMAGGTGETGIFIDRTTTPLQYVPGLGRITLQSLQATSGGASTIFSSTGLVSTSIFSCSVAESMDFVTSSTNPANSSIYFVSPNGDVAFGDVYGAGSQNTFTVIPGNNIMAYSAAAAANVGKLKFGLNRNGLGWTGQFGYGFELGQDSSRMMRMTRILNSTTDPSTTGPTCNATFDLSDSGDLTIKPSGGDLIVSGALTVTGTGLSGNVVVNNQLNVLGGATFAASTDVYFGGSTRGIIINGGKGSSDIYAYGNTEINIDGYVGNGVSVRGYIVNIGDVDGNANGTKIILDDNTPGSITYETGGTHGFSGNVRLGSSATDRTTIYGSRVVNEFVFNNGTARTVGISWANGNVQLLGGTGSGATGATAIYFTSAPATGSASVTLIVTSGGSMTGNTTFWGGNIKWPGGNKPTLSSNGTPDVISFVTPDAGTTIYGFVGGLNFA